MPTKAVKKGEYLLKWFLRSLFRLFFKKGDRSRCPVDPDSVESVLILRPDKLGDMIATIPAIHALKKRFPHLRVEVLASPRNKELIERDPDVDAVHIYRKNLRYDLPLVLRLRKRDFGVIYDPISLDSVTGLLLSKFIGKGAVRAASRKQKLLTYYDYGEPCDPDGHDHNYDNGLLIFNVFGIDPREVDPFLPVFVPEDSCAKADRFYVDFPREGYLLIGVNISAGSPTRSLPVSKYQAVLQAIGRERPSARFLIICTMNDRERGQQLVADHNGQACLIPESLSLLDVSAILRGVDVLISPDTSIVHIARLMRIPVVGLYSGAMRNYYYWRPYRQERGSVVAKSIGNIHDIEPGQVVEEFRALMESLQCNDSGRVPL